MPPPYRVVFQPSAFRRLLALTPEERDEVVRAVEALQADPLPDERRKRGLALPPDVAMLVYDGELVWIGYQIVDFEVISILTVVPWRRRRSR